MITETVRCRTVHLRNDAVSPTANSMINLCVTETTLEIGRKLSTRHFNTVVRSLGRARRTPPIGTYTYDDILTNED
jgi:hypothetical protein